MKKTLLIFIIILIIFVVIKVEALLLESEYQSYYGNINFLNNYQYFYSLPNYWSFRHYGTLTQSRNKRFQRYSRNADLVWQIMREFENTSFSLHMDFNAAIDKAKPDIERYEIEKTYRRIGLDVAYNIYDSLFVYSRLTYIHSDELNSRYSDGTFYSDGYHSFNNASFSREFKVAFFSLYSFLDIMNLDYDSSRNYGSELKFTIFDPMIDTELTFRRHTNKIFLLNDQIDTHTRSVYRASVLYRNRISDSLYLRLGDIFQVRDNRLRTMRDRNFLELDNSLYVDTEYFWQRFRFSIGGEYNILLRSFREDRNSRQQEQRIFKGSISYIFSERDSLIFKRNLNLTRTDYTISTNILDNDQLIDENQLSYYTYIRDQIKLINHLNYTLREEIYVNSAMSANNKTTRIYNFLPSLNIALTPNLLFLQDYHLRADYDDYYWGDTVRDRMYRKFSASYTLLTTFPWTKYIYPISLDRESLYLYNDMIAGVTYSYENNSSGNLVGNAYEVIVENDYHTLQMEIFRRIERFEFMIRPRFIWTTFRYEFNHQYEISYFFPNRNNYVSVGVNSSGTKLDDILWRANALLYFSF
ncbi:MAG: hypothetical protein K0B81_02035 [Candidatus Cloacimonetes bacterium]|nr:hypothetical protein [Candidatus Cloacimonadota bacterium]